MNKHPERKIQHQIMTWCREQGLKVYATANGQFLNSWSAIHERSTMGKGLPDLFLLIPDDRSINGCTTMVCCEVKSSTGRATKEQKEFLDMANEICGVKGIVAHSLEEVIMVIQPMLEPKPELTSEEVEALIHSL